MAKSIYKTIRLTPELAEWVERTSKEESRSQCNVIVRSLEIAKRLCETMVNPEQPNNVRQ